MRCPQVLMRYVLTLACCFQIGCAPSRQAADEGATINEHLVMGVLYAQLAAENRALQRQAFNVATDRLDAALTARKPGLPPAVIVDIDETLLDNSPYMAWMVRSHKEYASGGTWREWIDQRAAESLAGATKFLGHCDARGVAIFYISNRAEAQREATLDNLRRQGFPQAQSERLLLRTQTTGSSKESRRQEVMQRFDVLLLLGDNLSDCDVAFDAGSGPQRTRAVESLGEQFGRRYIVLPNAFYGDWERALYEGMPDRPAAERAELRRKALRPFKHE